MTKQGQFMRELLKQNPVLTAPMAGITDRAYREILHEMGAAICFCEMVSDKALTYGDKKTISLLNFQDEAPMVGVQLVGSEPNVMAKAAVILEKMAEKSGNVPLIDINMGCPVRKVVNNGEGSSLMTNPDLAVEIMKEIVQAVDLPVTAKMRLGWNEESKNVLELAERLQDVGCEAITIHGRTRDQFYSGTADWTLIAEAKKKLDIPVIGNGDIFKGEDAADRMESIKCDGVMIGRGMIGNPWLIRDALSAVKGEIIPNSPDIDERMAMAIRHLKRTAEVSGEYIGVRSMRSHLPWYIKGLRGAAAMRNEINQLTSVESICELLLSFAEEIKKQES